MRKIKKLLKQLDKIDGRGRPHYIDVFCDGSGTLYNGADIKLKEFDDYSELVKSIKDAIKEREKYGY